MEKYIEKLKSIIKQGRSWVVVFVINAIGQLALVALTMRNFETVLRLIRTGLEPYIKNGNIPAKILDLIVVPSSYITIIYILNFILFLGFVVYFIVTRTPKLPTDAVKQDPVKMMIGESHARDILGEMYEIAYQYVQNKTKTEPDYLIQMHEEVLRRFIQAYDLNPIGKPGEGPLKYDPVRHHGNEKLQPGSPVYIVNIGWEREGKVIRPALVRTQAGNKKASNHGNI